MINVNELRIGNKVFFHTLCKKGKPFGPARVVAVKELGSNACVVIDPIGLDLVLFYSTASILPIPLSAELFDKLYFEYSGEKVSETWFSPEIGYIGKCEGGYTLPDSDGEPSISYVLKSFHQLQNLYFALTYKELEYIP